jgi:hypothetical protein
MTLYDTLELFSKPLGAEVGFNSAKMRFGDAAGKFYHRTIFLTTSGTKWGYALDRFYHQCQVLSTPAYEGDEILSMMRENMKANMASSADRIKDLLNLSGLDKEQCSLSKKSPRVSHKADEMFSL